MPRPKRVESLETKAPRGVTLIWEYCPDVKRQAAALLHLLGIGDEEANTGATPQASAEHDEDNGYKGGPK
jgi:hypothetical protein